MLGKTDRTGKFGKIFLMIYRNPSCTVIWIEFRNYLEFNNTSQGLGIFLLKAQLVKKNLQILNNSQKYLS